MSREQDQKLVEAYERVIKGEDPKSVNEGLASGNSINEIREKLRKISGLIAKEKMDKSERNKILGKIRDAINLLTHMT